MIEQRVAEPPRSAWTELGAGRSGKVFLVETPDGPVARKVFGGDRLAKIVHYLFSGAPNPYIWNEDAVACALYRREIVALLAKAWFGPRL